MTAPIALFCFNRPGHTARTLEALSNNVLADQSDLFVYCDGPRSIEEVSVVHEVRQIAQRASGFRSVTVRGSHRNRGGAGNNLHGIRTTLAEHGRAICIEDDILTSPFFLEYMNEGLDLYADDPRIFSLSGFKYTGVVPDDYPHDVFLFRRFACWGWASWADRWTGVGLDADVYRRMLSDPEWLARLTEAGSDLLQMATDHVSGSPHWDTQAIVESAGQDMYSVFPRHNMTANIGFDGSGKNAQADDQRWTYPLDPSFRPRLQPTLTPNDAITRAMRRNF